MTLGAEPAISGHEATCLLGQQPAELFAPDAQMETPHELSVHRSAEKRCTMKNCPQEHSPSVMPHPDVFCRVTRAERFVPQRTSYLASEFPRDVFRPPQHGQATFAA